MVNLPNVPGVPALSSYSAQNIVLLVADAVSLFNAILGSRWGIYLNGAQAFPYRSIVDLDFKQDWPVSDYPVENGAFQSYDKVQLPFDVRVRVTSDGNEAARQALLNAVQAAANTLDLFDVVTPEMVYTSCNITHVDYKRGSQNGVGFILIDIWFVQIRVTSTATFTDTKTPGIAGQQNTGSVAPQAPSAAIQQGVTDPSGNSLVQ